MHLINEDVLSLLEGKHFVYAILEYLKKTDIIKTCPEYVSLLIEPYQDTDEKRREYAKHPKIKEIKKDINGFAQNWVEQIQKYPEIIKVDANPSPQFGLSNYIYIDIKITNPKLQQFYDDNLEKYDRVKFRFTEHGDIEYSDKKSVDVVELQGKTFIQASDEMKQKIDNYLKDLHNKERSYLKKLKNEKRKNAKSQGNKTESFKLRISEGVLINERLEEVAPSTYATDSAQDIANWLVNKPKPYRVIY